MSEPFIGEIRAFPYTFVPAGWLECAGQLVAVSQYTALFGVIGLTYGGNGQTNFKLPDLRGRAPLGQGEGPGLTSANIGHIGGQATVTLGVSQIPEHDHTIATSYIPYPKAPSNYKSVPTPGVSCPARLVTTSPTAVLYVYNPKSTNPDIPPEESVSMSPAALGDTGKGGVHENRQPFLVFRFCIAYDGIFPNRS